MDDESVIIRMVQTTSLVSHFCIEVKKYLRPKNLSEKCLLLLDNAPGHPDLTGLTDGVEIEFLPKKYNGIVTTYGPRCNFFI